MSVDKVMIVAEMSGNHNGSLKNAIDIIKAAKQAGADAIKLQTYTADTITLDCTKTDFMTNPNGIWAGRTMHSLFKEASTPWEWHEELFHVAKEEGLICFSSPFDKTAIDFLESLGNPIYKIASPEINDVNLIQYAARTGKPVIMSTGTATADDLVVAVDVCRKEGNNDITLLKCTTEYPAPIENANLLSIPMYRQCFDVKAGVSDHSMGSLIPIMATTLGATMIEKHFIIDRTTGGVDSSFSMDLKEFSQMVADVRQAEQALGTAKFRNPEDVNQREHRSLYIAEDMKAGDILTEKNLRSVRPGYGLHPKYLNECLGKKVNKDLEKGERFALKMIEL